jgi:hypothetical protein
MKTLCYFTVPICFLLTCIAGCVSTPEPSVPTATQQTIAAAVEDAISIGLVPVLTKNPSYIGAAQTVALGLGSFAGDTITPADVEAFLGKTSLAEDDRKVVAGIVNAAWGVYTRRYAQHVGASTRPDVKLFLGAVSNGIKMAVAATPR